MTVTASLVRMTKARMWVIGSVMMRVVVRRMRAVMMIRLVMTKRAAMKIEN